MVELNSMAVIDGDVKTRALYANSNLAQVSGEELTLGQLYDKYQSLIQKSIDRGNIGQAQSLYKEFAAKMVTAFRRAGVEKNFTKMDAIVRNLSFSAHEFQIVAGVGIATIPKKNDLSVIIIFQTIFPKKEPTYCEIRTQSYLSKLQDFQAVTERILAWREGILPLIALDAKFQAERFDEDHMAVAKVGLLTAYETLRREEKQYQWACQFKVEEAYSFGANKYFGVNFNKDDGNFAFVVYNADDVPLDAFTF